MNPKPFEKWKFEVIFDIDRISKIFDAMVVGPGQPKSAKRVGILIGKALENEARYLVCTQRTDFVLFEDGNVVCDTDFLQLPEKVLDIDLADFDNLEGLASLGDQIRARERSTADPSAFKAWSVTGYIRGSSDRTEERLVLRNNGTFCLPSYGRLWNLRNLKPG